MACIRKRVTEWTGIYVISDRHPSIMAAMSDHHLGWAASSGYHRICMRHLEGNFMTRFKDKLLKNMVCRADLTTTQCKFNRHMTTIKRINLEAQQWLDAIPVKIWTLSHDGGRRYGIMTTNMSKVINSEKELITYQSLH